LCFSLICEITSDKQQIPQKKKKQKVTTLTPHVKHTHNSQSPFVFFSKHDSQLTTKILAFSEHLMKSVAENLAFTTHNSRRLAEACLYSERKFSDLIWKCYGDYKSMSYIHGITTKISKYFRCNGVGWSFKLAFTCY